MNNSLLKFIKVALFVSVAVLAACSKNDVPANKPSAAAVSAVELKVGNWGPQSSTAGDIPNKQPDGSLGLWIQVSGEQGLGDMQVLFAGQPAKATAVQDKLITAAISPEQLAQTGNKEVVIKQVSTGKTFSVGTFNVTPAK